ncbi:hypothetical protein Ae168Ps1_3956 [Pseudonocardia sp. Ae168_Ps1]|nr:hypothetical protein Ae168Ps1_3956 [Pseudonocardia sp. Ae168_Ps1]
MGGARSRRVPVRPCRGGPDAGARRPGAVPRRDRPRARRDRRALAGIVAVIPVIRSGDSGLRLRRGADRS